LALGDGLGDEQLLAKIVNWARSEDKLAAGLQANPDPYDLIFSSAAAKITQIYGHGEFFDPEFTANSGFHAPATSVWIEDLPASRGAGFLQLISDATRNAQSDFGETHSITLLIDSLKVLDLLQTLDADFKHEDFRNIEKAISNSKTKFSAFNSSELLVAGALAMLGLASTVVGASAASLALALRDNSLNDADALENTVNALAKIFLGTAAFGSVEGLTSDASPTGFGNLSKRNEMHDQIARIIQATKDQSGLKIVSLIDLPLPDLQSRAQGEDGIAYRYALQELNPFVVLEQR
jgi:hypothetical protein